MSRVAKAPINITAGVEVKIAGNNVAIKGTKGTLNLDVHSSVEVKVDGSVLTVSPKENSKQAWAQAGTARALINNMVVGVAQGFQRKLVLNGVGYRAKASGNSLNLTLGFSHPVDYVVPTGVTVETPSQTEIVLSGSDKQLIGQVAAEIRAFRPPEPYKGKGVRYADEQVRRKEAKKK